MDAAAIMSAVCNTASSRAATASMGRRPMPGQAKAVSVTIEPPIRVPTMKPMMVIVGIAASGSATVQIVARAAGAKERCDIVVGVQRLPESSSPGRDTADYTVPIPYNVLDKLIEPGFHSRMQLGPGLAASWEIDGCREITFTLRHGVWFHNGDEMTAEDVAFSFSRERREGDGPVRLAL